MSDTSNMTHLGDGAYAEVKEDGGVWFAANDHRNRVVYLEPGAIKKLIEFAKLKGIEL